MAPTVQRGIVNLRLAMVVGSRLGRMTSDEGGKDVREVGGGSRRVPPRLHPSGAKK